MPQPPIPDAEITLCYQTYLACGKSWKQTAEKLGITVSAVQRRLDAYKAREADFANRVSLTANAMVIENQAPPLSEVIAGLRKTPKTLNEIAALACVSLEQATAGIDTAIGSGLNLHCIAEKWSIEKQPPLRPAGANARFEMKATANNEYVFGFVTDNHIGSKYARLDVLHDLYDRFAARGITQVFNAGNWIDGEARFNKFDLEVHGMDAQLAHLARNYPQRPGITTRFVAGDDHEGWYAQNFGVDIGRYAENKMREHGREDFVYLGYMESDVGLVNAQTGKNAVMRVVHPGGGSSYAISYSMQKLVESYEGGDKPAVVLGGHYHKLEILNYRNTWIIQGGTTEDQTPFMRKKKLEAHVGGLVVTLEQDPRTGAIIRCNDIYRYFNRGYYHQSGAEPGERFSMYGKVKLRARSLGGV